MCQCVGGGEKRESGKEKEVAGWEWQGRGEEVGGVEVGGCCVLVVVVVVVVAGRRLKSTHVSIQMRTKHPPSSKGRTGCQRDHAGESATTPHAAATGHWRLTREDQPTPMRRKKLGGSTFSIAWTLEVNPLLQGEGVFLLVPALRT